MVSIAPILAVPGIRAAVEAAPCRVVAVTPIVGGAPVRAWPTSCCRLGGRGVGLGVAGLYAGLADAFVLDTVDAGQAGDVAALGLEPLVVPTLMRTVEDAAALAKAALEATRGCPNAALLVVPLAGMPEVRAGTTWPACCWRRSAGRAGAGRRDVLAVTSKVVAKAEGRTVVLPDDPAARERVLAETVAAETARVVARRGRLVIAETRTGLVGANALVDASNAGGNRLVLLPADPDASAASCGRHRAGRPRRGRGRHRHPRPALAARADRRGRGPGRMGALDDWRGRADGDGRLLEVTEVAVADEVAAAADLVKGKASRVPAALLRGVPRPKGDGTARDLVRPPTTCSAPPAPPRTSSGSWRGPPRRSRGARSTPRSSTGPPWPPPSRFRVGGAPGRPRARGGPDRARLLPRPRRAARTRRPRSSWPPVEPSGPWSWPCTPSGWRRCSSRPGRPTGRPWP